MTDAVVRQARQFLRTARHAALAVLEPGTGAPLVSRVSVASDADGAPLILISQLSAHFPALDADGRCSLLFGEPGAGDPLAHPRMSVTARAVRLEGQARIAARARFLARHPKAELYADFADFAFWRLTPTGAALNGGFAKAYDLTAAHLLCASDAGLADMEPGAVAHMNEDHADAIRLYAQTLCGAPARNWQIATLDVEGIDMIDGDSVVRLWFDQPLRGAADLRPRLVALAKRAREMTSQREAPPSP
ncbi:MAG: DUF2470 domain-containing protein [Pseudomonadota bacterium]